MDPALIRRSRWANRAEGSFHDAAFKVLKASITIAGGNAVAIIVRRTHSEPSQPQYELACGHRRHQACVELGIPVRTVIRNLTDHQLTELMHHENQARKALRPIELGNMVKMWLDQGLYSSLRRAATAIDRDLGDLSKAVAIAKLPPEILSALKDPLELQFADGTLLNNALQNDSAGVINRVNALTAGGRRLSRADLVNAVTDRGVGSTNTPAQKQPLNVGPVGCGSIAVDAQGHTRVVLSQKLTASEFAEYTELHFRFLHEVRERRACQSTPASPRTRP